MKVIIIGDNPENQLEPFSEHIKDNPNAKWDWYQLGGRYSGSLVVKNTKDATKGEGSLVMENEPGYDSATKGNIQNINHIDCFAVLKNGKWYERDKPLWFGMSTNEAKSLTVWRSEVKGLLKDVPCDELISIYDLHF